MPRKQKDNNNDITNWYEKIPSALIPKYQNPSYNDTLIKHPARIIIVGNSGSGKTQLCLDFIKRMKNTFDNITLVCMNRKEPLYEYLSRKIEDDQLQVYEGVENIPPLDELDPEDQHLVIFDDLCLAKNQSIIQDYFIRSRKIAKGVTLMYLTQSFYKTPKVCRLNATHVIFKKVGTLRDLKMIMSDFALDVSIDELINMYKKCTDDGRGFLLIDIEGPPETRFRKNWLENITPSKNEKDNQY